MSNENNTASRINFASRLLNKAMSERKDSGRIQKISFSDAAKYAAPAEAGEKLPVAAAK